MESLSFEKDITTLQESIIQLQTLQNDVIAANEELNKEMEEDNKKISLILPGGVNVDIQSIKDEINKIQDNILTVSQEITQLKVIEKEGISLKKGILENKNTLKSLQQDLYFYELSTSLFKDIPTEIFKDSIAEVETAANDIIQRIIPTLQVKFWEDLEKKSRKLMISFITLRT